jgi:hypothetical protein
MELSSGIIKSAQRVVIYGPEGIGKSTFASKFPNPVFIDTEGGTKKLNITRTPAPSSWSMLLEQVRYFKSNPNKLSTLVIDTADWAEILCTNELCSKSQKSGIEEWGWGKGYTYLAEEFGRLLNLLKDLVDDLGINVVFTAHAQMKKFEQPDELGAYDRWEMKLGKKTAPLLREWADMVLFANYKTYVVNVDGQGVQKGKNKAQGGKRVMYTTHHNCWDAKNRDGLAEELPFDYKEISHCIPGNDINVVTTPRVVALGPESVTPPVVAPTPAPAPAPLPSQSKVDPETGEITETKPEVVPVIEEDFSPLPRALADLMRMNSVSIKEVQKAVASRGYYPVNTPIENYDTDFVNGVLIGAWTQVYKMITDNREDEKLKGIVGF